MPAWTVPAAAVPPMPDLTDQDAAFGPDILLRGDFVISAAGDWSLVEGVDAARQSIEREALAEPGEVASLPAWGMGLRALVMAPRTTGRADELRAHITERLRANPRVTRVRGVDVSRFDTPAGVPGVAVAIRAEVGGRDQQITVTTTGAPTP